MFIIDDVLLRCFGITLKPFDMIWLFQLMKDFSLREKYSLKKINNQIKENRLLFEIGELAEKEYKEKNEALLSSLEKAKEIMANLSTDIRIQEGIS